MAYSSLGYEIAKANKVLKSKLQNILAPYGITVQQFEVMRVLKDAPGLTAAQITSRVLSDSSTMMDILKRLTVRELIIRTPDPADRRIRRVYLTQTGEQQTEQLIALALAHNQKVQSCCSAQELIIISRILARLHQIE